MSAGSVCVAEVVEDLRVAEELRDLDQEAADEPGVLLAVVFQLLGVVRQRLPARSRPSGRAGGG